MALRDPEFRESKVQDRRRGVRLNSRVPVSIEWKGGDGRPLRAEVHTRIVSPYGCLVVLPHNLELEQPLQLTNHATRQSSAGVVVWKGHERTEGWELGIELIAPAMDFWGLEL